MSIRYISLYLNLCCFPSVQVIHATKKVTVDVKISVTKLLRRRHVLVNQQMNSNWRRMDRVPLVRELIIRFMFLSNSSSIYIVDWKITCMKIPNGLSYNVQCNCYYIRKTANTWLWRNIILRFGICDIICVTSAPRTFPNLELLIFNLHT